MINGKAIEKSQEIWEFCLVTARHAGEVGEGRTGGQNLFGYIAE
jgi:hypothetical protein